MKYHIKNDIFFRLTFPLIGILSLNPYIFWNNKQYIAILLFTVLFTLSIKYKNKYNFTLNNTALSIFLFLLVFIFFIYPGNNLLYALMNAASISLFILLKKECALDMFILFKKIFIYSLIPSIAIWFMHIFGIDISILKIGEIASPDALKVVNDIKYTIYPLSIFYEHGIILRLQGMYPEPGLVGSISALLLASNKFQMNTKEDKILFLGGALTFSLAFIIIYVIGVVVSFNKKIYIGLFSIFSMTILSINFLKYEYYDAIRAMTVSRLSLNEEGRLIGNNRDKYLQNDWNVWINSDIYGILFGVGQTADGSSWKSLILFNGITGVIIILLIYSILLNKVNINRYIFIYLILFFLSFIQRPGILNFYYIIIFYGTLIYLSNFKISHTSKILFKKREKSDKKNI
jgi:hypothetical protein